MEDNEIIDLYLSRNEKAIEETDRKYRIFCCKIANNILHNQNDTDEILNDTYFGLWNSIPPNKPNSLTAFIGRITRNLSLKKLRSDTTEKRGNGEISLVYEEIAECIQSAEDTEKTLESKELSQHINSFLYKLKDSERNVFICRYWYFDSIEEIAEHFGYSKSKVKTMLFRTRKKLYAELKSEGII